jgi:hypothetical protein
MMVGWTLLAAATIVVLGRGLYLWLRRGRAAARPARVPAQAVPVFAREGEAD